MTTISTKINILIKTYAKPMPDAPNVFHLSAWAVI